MPPRKSDASKAGGDEGATTAAPAATPVEKTEKKAAASAAPDGVNIEDLNLPKSIVTRLAKGVLPPNTQVQGNAMLAMSKSATVFVNYLATHANEHTLTANRKTISPQDVLKALDDIEFPEFKSRLEAELAKFNDIQTDKRNAYRKKVAAAAAASSAPTASGDDTTQATSIDPSAPPPSQIPQQPATSATSLPAPPPGTNPSFPAIAQQPPLPTSQQPNGPLPSHHALSNPDSDAPPTKKQRMDPRDLEDSMLVDEMIAQEEEDEAEEEEEEEIEDEIEEEEEEVEEEEDGDETLDAEEDAGGTRAGDDEGEESD